MQIGSRRGSDFRGGNQPHGKHVRSPDHRADFADRLHRHQPSARQRPRHLQRRVTGPNSISPGGPRGWSSPGGSLPARIHAGRVVLGRALHVGEADRGPGPGWDRGQACLRLLHGIIGQLYRSRRTGRPALIITAITTAASARMPAAHPVAVEYPWTSPCAMSMAEGPCPIRYAAVALAAIVLSKAVPSDPPTWLAVFTVAAATPAWRGSTPSVPMLKAGTITQEIPMPSRISAGSTSVR